MAVGLQECQCPHLNRNTPHGEIIRKAYEDAVVSIIRDSIPCREAPIRGEFNIAVIGPGGLFQESQWLQKLFRGQYPNKINMDLIDTDYKRNDPRPQALVERFVDEIKAKNLSITIWNSWNTFYSAEKVHHLVIGMDTEHATEDATQYQWEALLEGDIEKALIVRWNKDLQGHFFQVQSRKGSQDLQTSIFRYPQKSDADGNIREYINQELAESVAERISEVPITG